MTTPLVEAGPPSGPLASWHAWWAEHTRLRRFLTRTGVILSIVWLALVIVAAIFAPLVAPHDPDAQNLLATNAPVSANHLLGTDDLGRDVLSRLIYGARISMEVPFMTVGLALVLALVIGLVAGYRGGRIDYLLMRGADAGLAFPPLVLALAVVAVLGTGVGDVALALALVFAPGFARFIRGQTLAVKEESFVEASKSIGTPPARIVVFRVLPNVMTGLVVQIAIALGAALLAESGLAFLGLGPPPPAADWGSMLREAYDNSLFTHPWSLVPAGATIALTVLAFNTIGDALRDTLSGTAATAKRIRGARRQRGLTVVDRPTQPAGTTGTGRHRYRRRRRAGDHPGTARGSRPVHRVRHGRRAGARRGRRLLQRRRGAHRGPGRRVGVRQDGQLPLYLAPVALAAGADRGRVHPLQRRRPARRRLRPAAPGPRARHRHGLPGSSRQPRPSLHHRLPADRGDYLARAGHQKGGDGPGGLVVGERAHPRCRAAARRLPPPALGRHAPAGHDRHGAQLPSEPAHRRRADHRPGRDHSGPDRRAPSRAARAGGPGRALRHPRPRPHLRALRRDRRDVRRPGGRARPDGRTVRPSGPPLHRRPPGRHPRGAGG